MRLELSRCAWCGRIYAHTCTATGRYCGRKHYLESHRSHYKIGGVSIGNNVYIESFGCEFLSNQEEIESCRKLAIVKNVLRRGGNISQTDEMGSHAGTGLDNQRGLAARTVIQNGVESVAGAARLAIAAAEDLLEGRLTPGEATVINTTAGRVLKAAELYLRYARSGNTKLVLPPS